MMIKHAQPLSKIIECEPICAIIISYNPAESLAENVAALKPQVAEIVIVDNGSAPSARQFLEELARAGDCRVVYNNENLGIAAALNRGVDYAIGAGYAWLATFDQDSTAPPEFMAEMLLAWSACPFKEQVALVAPRFKDKQTDRISSYGSIDGGVFAEITHTMTSGNLVRSEVFSQVGLFDASFFIDCVDHDFCLRLRHNGYRLIEAHKAVLLHALGSMTLHQLFGRSCKVFNHSPARRYYNARNRVVLYRRYMRCFPGWVVRDLGNFCREIAGIILFEQAVPAKLAALGKGVVHGVIGKMGKSASI